MKKLLVTVIGAAAALGASAGNISTQRFETAATGSKTISELNTLAGGAYWSGDGTTNTYTIAALSGNIYPESQNRPLGTPTQALEIKTTFGNPLTLNVADGGTATNIPPSGIYFDSLVKFTVCEDAPTQEYAGAKIIMWLQEQYAADGETTTGTNIMVRANYANSDGSFAPTNFVCASLTGSVDDWHRVTIKTWADITKDRGEIPGFAIYIDGLPVNVATGGTMDDEIAARLSEAAGHLASSGMVFPSLVQDNAADKSTIASASFDGTGGITDLVFTDVAPSFAEDYVAPKAVVTIIGQDPVEYTTFDEVLTKVNSLEEGQTAEVKLMKGLTMEAPITFEGEGTIILDFAGFVLTNEVADAMITNVAACLIVTNSVGNGGIYSGVADGEAIYQTGYGDIRVAGGNFWVDRAITVSGDYMGERFISGGAFKDNINLAERLDSDKMFADEPNQETGLYDVIDYVAPTYTVTFVYGINQETTNTTANIAPGTTITNVPNATVAGYTYVWSPEVAEAVTADATYTAVYTITQVNVIFVDGDTATTNTVDYGTTLTAADVPNPEFVGKTGYTAAWDKTVAGTVVTDETIFTAVYTAEEYTITYYAADGTAFTGWVAGYDAPVTFAVTNDVTLPVAANIALTGVTFNGWTNSVGVAVTNTVGIFENLAVFANTTVIDAPTVAPIDPANGGEQTYDSADEAAAAAAAINKEKSEYIKVAATLTPEQKTVYLNMVEAVANGTAVTIQFKSEAEATVRTAANTAVTELPVAAVAAEDAKANIDATPGLYYSILSGTTPKAVTVEGERVLATGTNVELDLPKKGTAGFYKVKVSPTAKVTVGE